MNAIKELSKSSNNTELVYIQTTKKKQASKTEIRVYKS